MLACYEVLEHLPYRKFHKVISEIFRISEPHAILSLPDASRVYRFNAQIPKIGYIKMLAPLPRFKKPIHKFDGEYCYEMGRTGYLLSKIVKDIQKAEFEIERTCRVFENFYHIFFILRK